MEPICRRHRIATSLFCRWLVQFGLTAQKDSQPTTMAFAYGTPNDVPALAALRDFLRPPTGMTAIELYDGRRVFAPEGSSLAEVKQQLTDKEKTS